MSLAARSDKPELMDDPALDEATYVRCLTDLAALNRLTRTHAASLRWLTRQTADFAPGQVLSVLDVAYGDGDLLRAIAAWAAKNGLRTRLSGIDLNPRSAVVARAASAGQDIDFRSGDVFSYVPQENVDFIVSSQFTHHLADAQIVALLRWMDKTAKRGWFITDLQRHVIPYYGFALLARLCGWHRIVRLDGTVSIARGFRKAEWRALLARAGIAAKISWHLPFRFGIGRAV